MTTNSTTFEEYVAWRTEHGLATPDDKTQALLTFAAEELHGLVTASPFRRDVRSMLIGEIEALARGCEYLVPDPSRPHTPIFTRAPEGEANAPMTRPALRHCGAPGTEHEGSWYCAAHLALILRAREQADHKAWLAAVPDEQIAGWSRNDPATDALQKEVLARGLTFADVSAEQIQRVRANPDFEKTWLRDNAASVVVPEHPAVALLRDLEWAGNEWTESPTCPDCNGRAPSTPAETFGDGKHKPDCRLAAILAGSKPGERALSELLAEEREAGRWEVRAEWQAERDRLDKIGDETMRHFMATPVEGEDAAFAKLLTEERSKSAAEEREACAQIADEVDGHGTAGILSAAAIGALIRARGQR